MNLLVVILNQEGFYSVLSYNRTRECGITSHTSCQLSHLGVTQFHWCIRMCILESILHHTSKPFSYPSPLVSQPIGMVHFNPFSHTDRRNHIRHIDIPIPTLLCVRREWLGRVPVRFDFWHRCTRTVEIETLPSLLCFLLILKIIKVLTLLSCLWVAMVMYIVPWRRALCM